MKFLNLNKNKDVKTNNNKDITDPYIEIGNLTKEARIAKNLSIDDLSHLSKTKALKLLISFDHVEYI